MEAQFIPLLSEVSAEPEAAVSSRFNVLSEPANTGAFHAVGSVPPEGARACAGGKPAITLERDGDLVTRVRIQCPCGRVTELECLYSEGT